MSNVEFQYYKSPFGELIIGCTEGKLCLLDWRYRKMRSRIDQRIEQSIGGVYLKQKALLHSTIIDQLEEYFDGNRKQFSIPLQMIGTPFQKKVWTQLRQIPYGLTTTYKALSQHLENEVAIRAIASANGANAIAIVIPCHRVIGSDGSLVGYAGGLSAKRKLLSLEKADAVNQLMLFD